MRILGCRSALPGLHLEFLSKPQLVLWTTLLYFLAAVHGLGVVRACDVIWGQRNLHREASWLVSASRPWSLAPITAPWWAVTPASEAREQARVDPLPLQLRIRSQSSVLVDEDRAVGSVLAAVATLGVGLLGNISTCGLGQTCLFVFEVPQLGV